MAVAHQPSPSLNPAEIRRNLHLSRERMARLVDVSAKTIQRWEEQQTLPANRRVRKHLAQIQEIAHLGLIVYTEDGFREFLNTPLPVFNGLTALQLMELDRTDEVLGALATDYEGLGA